MTKQQESRPLLSTSSKGNKQTKNYLKVDFWVHLLQYGFRVLIKPLCTSFNLCIQARALLSPIAETIHSHQGHKSLWGFISVFLQLMHILNHFGLTKSKSEWFFLCLPGISWQQFVPVASPCHWERSSSSFFTPSHQVFYIQMIYPHMFSSPH